MKVSILTASVPKRADMLAEAIACVEAQTFDNVEHFVEVDVNREGAGPLLNRMLARSTGDVVMVLDDDDLIDVDHLERLVPHFAEGFDVVYSMPRIEPAEVAFPHYTREFSSDRLANMNCVAHNALMRADRVRGVGGWEPIKPFDWDLFKRLDADGARFCQLLGEVTWTYRIHGDNWSRGGLEEQDA